MAKAFGNLACKTLRTRFPWPVRAAHMQSAPSEAQGEGAQLQRRRSRPTQGELVEAWMKKTPDRHPIIDIGVNLTAPSFDKDRQEVVQRAQRMGLEALVLTGCCLRTSAAASELTDTLSAPMETAAPIQLRFTAGVHPHLAREFVYGGPASTAAALKELASHPCCVAVGECGLDFNRNFSPPADQERAFAAQIELAEELNKPLFMHCRDAGLRFFEIVRQHRRSVPGVLHCFTGSRDELETALALGLYVGITGWVCDDRPERGAAQLLSLVPLIPDDRLLIETDAPYLTPRMVGTSKSRPSRNEPALLGAVLQAVAAARGQPAAAVAEMTTANAKRLFGM